MGEVRACNSCAYRWTEANQFTTQFTHTNSNNRTHKYEHTHPYIYRANARKTTRGLCVCMLFRAPPVMCLYRMCIVVYGSAENIHTTYDLVRRREYISVYLAAVCHMHAHSNKSVMHYGHTKSKIMGCSMEKICIFIRATSNQN